MFERLRGAMNGAIQGWRNAGQLVPLELSAQQQRYLENWLIYTGDWLVDFDQRSPYRNDPTIYQNTRLLWKHAEAVVDFYAAVVYQGSISTDGKPLADGTLGAIPIEPQTPKRSTIVSTEDSSEESTATAKGTHDDDLLRALGELWGAWNWQQQKSFRPMYAAAFGDCLTEIVDDSQRRFVYPQVVWPGYVKEIELDYIGNVRRYVLEYRASEKRADGSTHTYKFRKEVDKEAFRYFREDQPYDQYGTGAVVPNVYGFVPAIWDRHRIGAPGHVRGRSAIDGTRQALMQLNSLFSHAFDFQRKVFFAPVMIASKGGRSTAPQEVDLSKPPGSGQAEAFDIVPVPDGAQLLQAQFDIGQTCEMLEDLREGIQDENPEARFYAQLREMQQVTAPGAERLMGDVKNRVEMVRDGADIQSVKLFQMAIAMAGMRVNNGDWSRAQGGRLTRRQQAFARFDLQSFDRGELDMAILPRPIVIPTEQERIETLALKESLKTQVAILRAWGEEDGQKVIEELRAGETAQWERIMAGITTGETTPALEGDE